MAFLEIRDLSYTYPNSGITAIDGLSLEVEKGELVAVIGPNAAGKSTLALLLKGLLKPDSGGMRVNGNDRTWAGPDPRIGILFSNPENQLVTSIVEEDIAFGLEVLGEPSSLIEKKVEEVMSRLGISHLRKRMPHLLSGGEQQMTALAGVLVLDPDILILDEPTTYLDPDARTSVLASVRQLREQGKAILWITHDMKEAAMADRVMFLDGGRIAMEGKPEILFKGRELEDRYGIRPPFLLSLVLGMRSMGLDIAWPPAPGSLVNALSEPGKDTGGSGPGGPFMPGSPAREEGALIYDDVHFSYGLDPTRGGKVLEGVGFSVQKGAIAFICGANGSGKSTLLQMSNGIITPDSGHVLLGGKPLREWRKKPGGVSGRVALLFQNAQRQVFSATVYDDIAFGPRNMGIGSDKVQDRVLKATGWVGLSEAVLSRPVHSLSGGQMRRVAVAGVLAMEPEVLVLDEPTDGLDPGGTREFYTSARRFCDETGTALLMASHEVPEEVASIDHLGHLADARMQSTGAPSSVLRGSARTIPKQFLPEHLVLGEELLEAGLVLPDDMLDPGLALQRFLELAKG